MTERLRRSGLRAIHPVVDVTNYVMLELGQPLHAYDLTLLNGAIRPRFAKKGEKLTLLDEKELDLSTDTLLITDKSGPIGLAGIMGGLSTAVSEVTKDIFFEAAFWPPSVIAGRRGRMDSIPTHPFDSNGVSIPAVRHGPSNGQPNYWSRYRVATLDH